MIDETGADERSGAPTETTGAASERIAFCQQCGRELTAATVRRVGNAVYCEPCLVTRLEGSPTGATGTNAGQWASVGSTTPPPPPGSAPGTIPGEPNPWLAAVLGLIPGVGAMYNGQYAKGLAHLVIFAILDALAHDVNAFGIFVVGWICYQAFDAYHTAKARRDGTPLPNPFGLNDIGDRMGFGRNWPGSAARPVTTAPPGGWTAGAATPQTPPPAQGPNWAGYVPHTNFGATAPPPPPPAATASDVPPPAAGSAAPWSAPYSAPYTAEPWQTPPASATPPPVMPTPPARRFPVGAIWLIGLGLLFLLANLDTSWRLSARWSVPVLLALLGSWLLYRRAVSVRNVARLSGEDDAFTPECARRLVCQIRLPVMLLVLALLFAIQSAGILTFGQTWPVLFIAFGALLLIERTVGRGGWYPAGVNATAASAGYVSSAWTSGAPPDSGRKDGQ
jgi:hypothetical protein